MAEFHSDVLIIGAGAAGMAAARALSARGLDIRLIEARDRIGGRIHTERPPHLHFPIELGAEYVHGCPPALWEIVNEAGIRLNDTCVNHWTSQDGTLTMQTDYYGKLEAFFEDMLTRAEDGPDQTLQTYIDELHEKNAELDEPAAASLRFVRNYLAADPAKIGLKFLAQGEIAAQGIGTDALQVIDGYDNIIRFLLKSSAGLQDNLHLNTIARRIRWQKGKVEVDTISDGELRTFTARRLLLTLPIGVLKRSMGQPLRYKGPDRVDGGTEEMPREVGENGAPSDRVGPENGAVHFDPPLDDKIEAVEKIEVGDVRRIVVIFKERFWEELELEDEEGFCEFGFITCDQAPISHWWSQFPVRSPILVGWVPGEAASQLPHGADRLRKLVVKSLAIIFGFSEREIGSLVKEIFQHDWAADPYSRGAYSYRTAGHNDLAEKLAQPIDDTLFFAGEATEYSGFSGTVHGAIKTGLRAAAEILTTLSEVQAK